MRLPRKWALSLGLLATAPGITWAGPTDKAEAADAAASRATPSNQDMAKTIAAALKKASLRGKGISLEYKSGTCTITGEVADPQQRALATRVISSVAGVESVDNKLTVSAAAARQAQVAQAGYEGAPSQRVQRVNNEVPAGSNQVVAQSIAESLSAAGLAKYDIEIRYSRGVATLAGNVSSLEAAQQAEEACRSVDGVQNVNNRLLVNGQPMARPQSAVAPAGYPQMAMGPGMQAPQMAMNPAAAQAMMMQGAPPAAMAGGGGPVNPAGHLIYNQPNVPQYAWPTYAAYDNSAAVTYPSMYDASAWPYIGPYYPYPQVPLGWRKSTLEWKDGYWSLKFNSRTDRWWWFMNPHNWSE